MLIPVMCQVKASVDSEWYHSDDDWLEFDAINSYLVSMKASDASKSSINPHLKSAIITIDRLGVDENSKVNPTVLRAILDNLISSSKSCHLSAVEYLTQVKEHKT